MPFSASSARAGCCAGSSNTAVTWPCSAPWRTSAASPRAPSASANASSRIDLPAPVSPVSTGKARREIDIEPVDQDDVADREPGEHGPVLGHPRMRMIRAHHVHCADSASTKDADGRDKPGHRRVDARTNDRQRVPSPTFLKARLIQEPLFSAAPSPPASPADRRPCTSGCPGNCARARPRRSAPRRRCRAPYRPRSAASAPPRRGGWSGTASPRS